MKSKNESFCFILVSITVLAIVTVIAVHLAMSHRITSQNNRNDFIKSEINLLDKKIVEIKNLRSLKDALIARMGIIQELQLHRPRVVHLFDDIVIVLPKGIHLTKVLLKGDKVLINGFSESNTSISAMMRNINAAKWLAKPVLSEIKTTEVGGKNISDFSLESVLTDPKKKQVRQNESEF